MYSCSIRLFRTCCMVVGMTAAQGVMADISFLATQTNLGGTFFPTYTWPQNSIVPWRSDAEENFYSASSDINERYYGRDGYALFATRFSFPNADSHPPAADAFINPTTGNPDYPNLISLPSFVTGSQIFAERMAAGWAYALIDDPRLQAGPRLWTFDGVNYPPPTAENVTGVTPYVKLGVLDGRDVIADTDPVTAPAARWGFEVGANVPPSFRVGVMTDGLDGTQFAPGEVFLTRLVNGQPVNMVSSGALTADRFVDMHFFDINDAQPGDQYLFSAMAAPGGQTAAIAGFSFDILTPFVSTGADFNGDTVVDGADFLIWQRNLGLAGAAQSQGDANNDTVVDASDLAAWKLQFGPATVAAVPEPAAIVLAVAGVAAALIRTRFASGGLRR